MNDEYDDNAMKRKIMLAQTGLKELKKSKELNILGSLGTSIFLTLVLLICSEIFELKGLIVSTFFLFTVFISDWMITLIKELKSKEDKR